MKECRLEINATQMSCIHNLFIFYLTTFNLHNMFYPFLKHILISEQQITRYNILQKLFHNTCQITKVVWHPPFLQSFTRKNGSFWLPFFLCGIPFSCILVIPPLYSTAFSRAPFRFLSYYARRLHRKVQPPHFKNTEIIFRKIRQVSLCLSNRSE